MSIYWLIYLFILSAYYYSRCNPEFERVLLYFIMSFLIVFAGMRGLGVARDMYNYVYAFDSVTAYSDNLNMEPAAKYIPVTLKYFGIYHYQLVFFIFASIGVFLKFYNLQKYSSEILLSILMYYSYTYFLHEFTQIRAGVAIGFFLWSLQDIFERNKYKFIIKIFVAMCFHISSVLFLFCYFFSTFKLNKAFYIMFLIFCIVIGTMNINIIKNIPYFSGLSNKIDVYMLYGQAVDLNGSKLNGILDVFYIFIACLLLYFSKTIYQKDKRSILFIKLFIIGISLHYLLTPISLAFGLRFFELFIIVAVICLLYLRYVFSQKYIAIIICVVYSFYFLFLNTFRSPILESYHV